MTVSRSLFTPRGNDFLWEMHQQEIFKVPSLKQERRHTVLLYFIRSAVPIVIALIYIYLQ